MENIKTTNNNTGRYTYNSTRDMYNNFITSSGREGIKASLCTSQMFRDDLSVFHMTTQQIESGSGCRWDQNNICGVPLDYDKGNEKVYIDGSDSHTLVIGATGSKKSRLVVMPSVYTIAAGGEGMIICDPKGEIYQRTAGYLSETGYSLHVIDLRNPSKGDGWNILEISYRLFCDGEIDKSCEFINDITINLIPIDSKDPYWDYSARNMLFGLIMLLFKICKENNLDDLANMQSVLQLREELFDSTNTTQIKHNPIWDYVKNDPLIRSRLSGIVVCPSDTMSCIISIFDRHMSCFSLQPQVTKLLSHSTFQLNHLGVEKEVIFMIMPDEKTTYHKIISIFVKQLYEFLIDLAYKSTPENRFIRRINFILDEFSSLPTIPDFPQMITASRSRNIRFVLVVQSRHQLKQRYAEETTTIMSNCQNWIFLASREIELLKSISELCGTVNSNHDPLVSLFRLQHLNKDVGECLVLSGRKYPYFAKLADVDEYDGGNGKALQQSERDNSETNIFDKNPYYFKSMLLKSRREELKKEFRNEMLHDVDFEPFNTGGQYE